jgi:hypothetical protein
VGPQAIAACTPAFEPLMLIRAGLDCGNQPKLIGDCIPSIVGRDQS